MIHSDKRNKMAQDLVQGEMMIKMNAIALDSTPTTIQHVFVDTDSSSDEDE